MGHGWSFVGIFLHCPPRKVGLLVHFGLCFALWGGGLVHFSPLPCESNDSGDDILCPSRWPNCEENTIGCNSLHCSVKWYHFL